MVGFVAKPLEYYAVPASMTDPGDHTDLFDGLFTEIPTLCRVVQGLLLHVFWVERDGVTLSQECKQYEHQKETR